ncbi:MAG: hypothetical protein ABR578_00590 [Chromatocurvus sp.]
MNRQPTSPAPAEKQRLRNAISRHVDHYLARGGKIEHIDTPQRRSRERVLSAWRNGHDVDDFLPD